MNEYQAVRTPPSRFDGRSGLVGALVTAALFLAILKPWGNGADNTANVPQLTPPPSQSPSPRAPPAAGFNSRDYDPSIFGNHEPASAWAIWPAGYLVTYGFVVQVPGVPPPVPAVSTAPASSGAPSAATPSAATPSAASPSSEAADGGPAWPARFVVQPGNHLLLIGIDMPAGISLKSWQLTLGSPSGGEAAVGIDQLPSPWPDHFAVIGIPSRVAPGLIVVWPPGLYRLDLVFEPGGIRRTMQIQVSPSFDNPG